MEINMLKRLISPPSVGKEDTYPSIIQFSQLYVSLDKESSPIRRENLILELGL